MRKEGRKAIFSNFYGSHKSLPLRSTTHTEVLFRVPQIHVSSSKHRFANKTIILIVVVIIVIMWIWGIYLFSSSLKMTKNFSFWLILIKKLFSSYSRENEYRIMFMGLFILFAISFLAIDWIILLRSSFSCSLTTLIECENDTRQKFFIFLQIQRFSCIFTKKVNSNDLQTRSSWIPIGNYSACVSKRWKMSDI